MPSCNDDCAHLTTSRYKRRKLCACQTSSCVTCVLYADGIHSVSSRGTQGTRVLCRSWWPGVTALLGATLNDVLFQPTFTLTNRTSGVDSGAAARRGVADAAAHRRTAGVNDSSDVAAPVPDTHVAAPAERRPPHHDSGAYVNAAGDGRIESTAAQPFATGLNVVDPTHRAAFGLCDLHDTFDDTRLTDLLMQDSEQHGLLHQIRDALRRSVSPQLHATACTKHC